MNAYHLYIVVICYGAIKPYLMNRFFIHFVMSGWFFFFSNPTPLLSDDYENTALFPLPANYTSGHLLGSVDPLWQPPGVQDSPIAAVVPLCVKGFSSSSQQSSISDQGPRLIQLQEHSYDRQCRKHFGELMSTSRRAGIHDEGTRTLGFFIDHPTEPTFSQERNNLHAMEVSVLMGGMRNWPPQQAVTGLDWTCQSSNHAPKHDFL